MNHKSLALRSATAVALMIGFYMLALGAIAVLLYIPYSEMAYARRLHFKLALFCVAGAGSIAFAILPRLDRFEDPGPELPRARFARLFARLEAIARRTGQEMPSQVFLVADLNAWVSSRGGLMGFGSRRIMGIGWPLLQALNTEQVDAVLAHEFGHYHGGDTRLGPWIYKTREAIGRTLRQLGDQGWLHLPFRWYGTLFLRLTHAISRAQEFAADRLAAQISGAWALASALQRVHACAPAFGAYWSSEVSPVLRGGYRTPLAHGFSTFLGVPNVQQAMASAVAQALTEGTTDPYDTHPSLRDRIAALGNPEPAAGGNATPAIELLEDVDAAEAMLLAFLTKGAALQPLSWDAVPETLFVPNWRKQNARLVDLLDGTPLRALPSAFREKDLRIAAAVSGAAPTELSPDALKAVLCGAAGSCLAIALVDHGYAVRSPVGEPIALHKDGLRIEPFAVAQNVLSPESDAQWSDSIEKAGLASATLRLAASS